MVNLFQPTPLYTALTNFEIKYHQFSTIVTIVNTINILCILKFMSFLKLSHSTVFLYPQKSFHCCLQAPCEP